MNTVFEVVEKLKQINEDSFGLLQEKVEAIISKSVVEFRPDMSDEATRIYAAYEDKPSSTIFYLHVKNDERYEVEKVEVLEYSN